MKRNLQFGHILTIMFLLCAFLPSRAQENNLNVSNSLLVEEGRTWWYYYSYNDSQNGDLGEWERVNFGLTFSGTEERDGKVWSKCMAVSEDGIPMMDFPVAFLREQDNKVFILPYTITESECEQLKEIPDLFHLVYSRFLDVSSPYRGGGEFRQDVDSETILYDWNMVSGATIEYPWIYNYFGNAKISITSCSDEDGRKIWTGTWGWDSPVLIVEGVGSVANHDLNTSTFLYPCCYIQIDTGIPYTPKRIYLEKVTDKNGKVIYGDTGSEPEYPLMVTDSKIWNYTDAFIDGPEEKYYDKPGFHFGEQMELNGHEYTAFMDGEDHVYAYLRQEGPRVYIAGDKLVIYDPFTEEKVEKPEYLLYDFSLNPGDRFETLGFDYVGWHEDSEIRGCQLLAEVQRTYEKEINGRSYRYQEYDRFVSDTENRPPFFNDNKALVTVIEGIGPTTGYLCFPGIELRQAAGFGGGNITFLSSVITKDGEMLWDDRSGVESVEADANQSTDGTIYDLYGRRVVNPLPGTIYIRDGRKYVAR